MHNLIKDYLNKKATITPIRGLEIDVKIIDVKKSYGRDRFKVEPIRGKGAVWVEHVELKQ